MTHSEDKKLGQWLATAICGNDILSSALYVSGIAVIFAGVYAPVVLLLVGLVLFFYKAVYTEVVEALPINGGAYNCLLNATAKRSAAIAGVMTILSYIATAVLSAKVGVEYLFSILPELGEGWVLLGFLHLTPVILGTIALLGVFALLVVMGIKDSAKVAFGIFSTHIVVLTAFVGIGAWYLLHGGANFFADNLAHTGELADQSGGTWNMLFLAFSASLLGISGFESSANFVEEQKKGVFRKTLRNMLTGVVIFNTLIALVVTQVMPYSAVVAAKDFLLSEAAGSIGGNVLRYIVVIDAFLVLSGAVLTSYVGVSGLMSRMAIDSCLPESLARVNARGSYPGVILVFFLLCASILIATGGNLLSLAGVYTIAFLGVMTLFALGNWILKETRGELKRTYHAPLTFVILAFLATTAGIVGNIYIDSANLAYFLDYFIPTVVVVFAMLYRDNLIAIAKRVWRKSKVANLVLDYLHKNVTGQPFVVFLHNSHRLHEIMRYFDLNETSWKLIFVFCGPEGDRETDQRFAEIGELLPHLKKAGVYPHFDISLKRLSMEFGPEAIDAVEKEFDIPRNRIFIGSIHHHHQFDYSDLGGVRIIF